MLLNESKYGVGVDGLYWRSREIKLYGESKLHQYADDLINRFANKAAYISNFLRTGGPFSTDVYLFLDEEKYTKFLKSQDCDWTVDSYKKATYNNDTIVILCDEEKLINKPFHYANVFAHVYFHVLFRLSFGNPEGTLWFEEGMAQLLSGERNRLEDEEFYKNSLMDKVFDEKWKIPMIENLWEHGNEPDKFDSDDYNGYTISYMLVRYLRDQRAPEAYYKYILSHVALSHYIRRIDKDIISRVYNYYGTKFNIPGFYTSLSSVKTPEDLFDYMEIAITHGWLDVNGEKHEHTLEGIRDIYQINSIEQVLESGLATCIEQTMLEQYVLDNLGIENKIFVNRIRETGDNNNQKVRLHCFCAYKTENCWCYFEHANKTRKGIHRFYSLRDLCNYHLRRMDVDRFLTEIPEIPVGYTIKEFNDYVNTFEILDRGAKIR